MLALPFLLLLRLKLRKINTMNCIETVLKTMAENYASVSVSQIKKIPQSGSNRQYFRVLFLDKSSIIGVFNDDVKENEAFFSFTKTFFEQEIAVPELLDVDESRQFYLLSDLGDETLYAHLTKNRSENGVDISTKDLYFQALRELPKLQVLGREHLDFSLCYPRAAFDQQSMQWDLNYFKYYFLKLAHIPFDEQALENDFATLIVHLSKVESDFFLFRDFQSRNIMVKDNKAYFIDYQGGRKGALAYDLASLLYDGKADLSNELREELLQFYLDEVSKLIPIDRDQFVKDFYNFVLIRILQALGAYGYRGYYEKKAHFLLSIPFAMQNLQYLLQNSLISISLPTLFACLEQMFAMEWGSALSAAEDTLTVLVTSFSFKKEFPQDMSGNGGGFVFDCRFLPNPGREVYYKDKTGRDQEVMDYLEKYQEVADFKTNILAIVKPAVDNYLERKFNHLMINFGCTGGQHRSVYFAEQTAKKIQELFPNVKVILKHTVHP